jgi:hypothetical protein
MATIARILGWNTRRVRPVVAPQERRFPVGARGWAATPGILRESSPRVAHELRSRIDDLQDEDQDWARERHGRPRTAT